MKINLNEPVKFKLTDYGKDIYYHQYDELNEYIKKKGHKPFEPKMPKVDKNGYTEMQLWCFIELYGNYIGIAKPNIIEPLEIIYDHPTERGGAEFLASQALALINRQQAEIERLENAIIAMMSYLDILGADKTDTSFINQATEFNKQIRADIKSEAIKEFLESKYTKVDICNAGYVYETIKKVKKEMVGEQNV